DGDGLDAAEALDERDRRGIERRDAVPQHVAAGCPHENRALADGEGWRRADADDVRLVLAEGIHVARLERIERRPGLAARRHVLTLLLAEEALRGRLCGLRILCAAGGADVEGHGAC